MSVNRRELVHGAFKGGLVFGTAFAGFPEFLRAQGNTDEHFWIFNKDDKTVWKAERPDKVRYHHWEKPEWSTHPDYATAIALYDMPDPKLGDLYVVKIGDLADADEGEIRKPDGYLRIATGKFDAESFSHLWVEP